MTAQELGRTAARALRAEHGTNDPDVLAARLGVTVMESDRDGGWGTVVVFADYLPGRRHITLYKAAIAAHGNGARAHYLAHELFHHWEMLNPGRCRRAESEEAADAFARELLEAEAVRTA